MDVWNTLGNRCASVWFTGTLLHSEHPKLYRVLAVLSAIGVRGSNFAMFVVPPFQFRITLKKRVCTTRSNCFPLRVDPLLDGLHNSKHEATECVKKAMKYRGVLILVSKGAWGVHPFRGFSPAPPLLASPPLPQTVLPCGALDSIMGVRSGGVMVLSKPSGARASY